MNRYHKIRNFETPPSSAELSVAVSVFKTNKKINKKTNDV